MAQYNFKNITVVPTANELQDIVLSNTQRKTPTVIHKNYKISRIRSFYMRKVKHTQMTYQTKLEKILTDFPKIEDVHPFYADLMNVLYEKNHYKIALSQVSVAKNLISNIAKEYCRLLKYGETLYRCKQLKRAALGRMCTLIRRQKSNLVYLEEVRQHLSRLPSINPLERTLIICGFPNVGKSSFMNKVTRADVDVQPYAFTTKSLFVGHFDYKYVRFQVIDTPGILDHPLEERNTIEMQSITALAHLKAAVLFFMDVSEQCGHSLEAQASLFHSIRPLFTSKPTMLVVNKTDIITPEELSQDKQKVIQEFEEDGVKVVTMSTLTEQGVHEAKMEACEKLLTYRLEMKRHSEKTRSTVETRLMLHMPKPRDNKERLPCIPEAALRKKMEGTRQKRKLEREVDELGEGYVRDVRKTWDLKNKDEIYDSIPEILNGKNIADFIDPDIEEKLKRLEEEEERREAAGMYDESDSDDDERIAIRRKAAVLREKRKIRMMESREKRRVKKARLPRAAERKNRATMEAELGELGIEIESGDETHLSQTTRRSRSASQRPLKRKREESEMGRSRSSSRPPRDKSGMRDEAMVKKARKIARKAQRPAAHQAKKGEGDRVILNMKPKHLFAGKRKMGKTSRR